MSRTIEIIVAPDGQSRVETTGFAGAECREASRFIERALGRQVDETLTSEYHQAAVTEHQVHQDQ